MDIGGTRSSLINLLTFLSKREEVEIDLLIMSHHGKLMSEITTGINVLPPYKYLGNAFHPLGISGKIYHAFVAGFKKVLGYKKVYGAIYKKVAKDCFFRKGEYDAVFGYQEGLSNDCSSFIKAKKHYTWIHNDTKTWYDEESFISDTYAGADGIFFVADAALSSFGKQFPENKCKLRVIKNTLNQDIIIEKSKAEPENSIYADAVGKKKMIVSVGRFAPQKAFERIIPAALRLKKEGIDFLWTVVGGGELFYDIKEKTKAAGLLGEVIFTGATPNPYPYIKNADVLAVTSHFESQPMVIIEALTLGVPVVSTDFSSAGELLAGKDYAIICGNNEQAIEDTLCGVLKDQEKLRLLKESTVRYSYPNEEIIDEIVTLC